jgi:hypothetical protein
VIKPRRPPETGKSGAIFEDSLLNSLLAGNCGRRKHGFSAPVCGLIEESKMLAGRAVSRETKHERNGS